MTLFDNETDLLAQVEAVEIDNTERISPEDREYCMHIQKCCHQALDQLERNYRQMMEDSKEYIESGTVKIQFNDTYGHVFSEWQIKDPATNYRLKHFIPCMQERTIRNLFAEACHMFANDIVDYFNDKYGINVKRTDRFKTVQDITKFDPTFRPQYEDIVDDVIAHLGGRSFAQTMEDEIYANALRYYHKDEIEIKGSRLTVGCFADACFYRNELSYETQSQLEKFIDALHYYLTGHRYPGGINGYLNTNRTPEVSKTYGCVLPKIEHFKFYKNRKMEVKFKSESDAKGFYERIKQSLNKN